MSLDHGIETPHSGNLPPEEGGERPVREFDKTTLQDAVTEGLVNEHPTDEEIKATIVALQAEIESRNRAQNTGESNSPNLGDIEGGPEPTDPADDTDPVLAVDEKGSGLISRRAAVAALVAAAVGVVGGGIGIGISRSHHDAKPDHTSSAPGNTKPDQGEKGNQLTPEQQARAALKPELAMARIYTPEWNQPGGKTLENIDQDALFQVVQQLLNNQVYVMETGNKDALKYVYETDPDGTINKQQFSQQLKAFDIECARYQKWQKESPYQPVETAVLLKIDNFGLRGTDIVTVDFTYQDNYFDKPKDSKSGGKAEASENKMHWEFTMQHREDPNSHEKDQPAFVLTTDEAISSTPVQLH